MQTFAIKPLFDFRDESWPSEVSVDLPSKSTVSVEQYANFVYFHVHYNPAMETIVKRTVCLIVAGEAIPDAYEHIGTLVPFLSVDEGGEVAEQGDEPPTEIGPLTEEDFYSNYRIINVYIAPETPAKLPLAAWSFGRDK